MEKIASYDDLLARVRTQVEKQAAKQGDSVNDVKDPNLKGGATPPTSERQDGDEAKRENPKSIDNKDEGQAGKTLEHQEAETHKEGEGPTKPKTDPSGLPTEDLFAKKATDVVASLRAAFGQKKEASTEKQETKVEDTKKEASTEKKEDKTKVSKKAKETTPDDIAGDMDAITADFHLKLASHILATEEGKEYARDLLSRSMSAQAVQELIDSADDVEKRAAEELAVQVEFEDMLAGMTDEQREAFQKSAAFHYQEVNKLQHLFEKAAYEQGAMDAAAMVDGGVPELPGMDSEPSLEEIVMILDELVQSGELDPALADAILQELLGGVAGDPGLIDPALAGVDAGVPPMSPEEEAMLAEMGKVASAADEAVEKILAEDKED